MSDNGNGTPSEVPLHASSDRLVYVMPHSAVPIQNADSIDLTAFWRILWEGKWIILAVTLLAAVGSVVYALSLTHWYRSEILLTSAEGRTASETLAGQLGGLASLAGVTVGSGSSSSVEALAVLRSREFTRTFIEDESLMPILFEERWNPETQQWLGDAEEWPDIRDGVRYFSDEIRKVEEDFETGLVTVAIEWPNPELAAKWASLLVDRLNFHMRERALSEAETNLRYLREELESTSVVALQQSIGRLLEGELQKVMLARGNAEFAFRIIDPAQVPQTPVRPRRRILAMAMTAAAGVLSVVIVLLLHGAKRLHRNRASEASV